MTTVVVFGGTGFLGRRLVNRLAAERAIVPLRCGVLTPMRSGVGPCSTDQSANILEALWAPI
jgi:uncharacterized protein YbjT (DUF2867 family)